MRRIGFLFMVLAVVTTGVFATASGEEQPTGETGTVELVMWSHWGGEVGKRAWMDEVVAAYEAANPDVRIRIEWYGDKNDLYTQLNVINQAAGVNAPDIHTVDFRPYGHIPQQENGWLLNLKDGLDVSHWDPGILGAASYDDGIWGLPVEAFGIWVWYDKNLFSEWGIEVPSDGRMSWDLFEEIRAKAKENDMVVFGQGVQNLPVFAAHYPMGMLLEYAGPDLVRQAIITGEKPYNDPVIVEGLQAAVDLIPELFNKDVVTLALFEGAGLFFNRRAALTVEGSWLPGWLSLVQADGAAPDDIDLGMMRFPMFPDGRGNGVVQWGAGSGWAASAFTEHPDTVIDFFNFVSTPERARNWLETTHVPTGMMAETPPNLSELVLNAVAWQKDGPSISPAIYQVPWGDEANVWVQGMSRFFADPNYTAQEFLDEMQRVRESNSSR